MSETETLEAEQTQSGESEEKKTPEMSDEQDASDSKAEASVSDEIAAQAAEQQSAANEATASPSTSESDAVSESGADEADKPKSTRYKTIKAQPEKIEPAPLKELEIPDVPEIQRILKLQVPVIVRLAEKVMKVSEILDMNPGMIIEFDKTVDEPLDLMINNKCIGQGQTVKVGENFGLRVTKIIPLGQIIQAMGQSEE